jgi:2,4-dienoyl-CoA reductase-like NADH-dependent reductase (Old Yellow Enzyme family)
MGSEGYLINEFIAAHTNQRDDEWGGSYENRMRFPAGDRAPHARAGGANFIIIYRLSMLDLVEGGSTLGRGGATGAGAGGRRPPSSTPALAGTRRAFPPLPPRCRARRLPG